MPNENGDGSGNRLDTFEEQAKDVARKGQENLKKGWTIIRNNINTIMGNKGDQPQNGGRRRGSRKYRSRRRRGSRKSRSRRSGGSRRRRSSHKSPKTQKRRYRRRR